MGRPVNPVRPESMHLVLCCVLVYVSLVPRTLTGAEHLEIYPEYPDAAIIRRIQRVLSQWRQYQLRRENAEPEIPLRIPEVIPERIPEVIPERIPEFTYRFPEDANRNYQNDFFAVPPSDPRFYNPDPDLLAKETKRLESEPPPSLDEEFQNPTTEPEDTSSGWTDDQVTSETSEPTVETTEGGFVFKKLLARNDQDIVLVAIIAGCGAAAAAGVVALSIGWYKLHTNSKAAADIEYPAYGVTGPNKEITPTGDRRLAQSAQMYHYQHQKQQIIAMESNRANNERRGSVSEGDSEEENEEGDYTVYECPGLAATGELEVKNPLFLDDPTPAAGNHVSEEPRSPPADKKQ